MKKKILAGLMTLALVFSAMPANVFAEEANNIETDNVIDTKEELKEALLAGGTIVLGGNIETDEVLSVSVDGTVIDGQGTYAVTGLERKTFEVYADAEFKDVEVLNTAYNGRCVDTRDAVELTLTNVELTATNGNTQPLTIGGYENGTTVTMSATTIEAGESGYGIISFVKTEMTISDGSSVNGYGALYMKEGSEESVVTVAGSTLSTKNVHSGESNAFGTIITEAGQVTITVDAGSKVIAEAEDGQTQAALVLNEQKNLKFDIADGAAVTTDTLVIGYVKETNTITVPSSLADLAISEGIGYVDEASGQITLGGQVEENETVAAMDSEGNVYASLKDAVERTPADSTITLMADIETNEIIKIEKAITIEGNGHKVTGTAGKTFEVYDNAEFNNIEIENTAYNGRCVDTRKAVELTLTKVELTATNGNSQPLTIGGNDTETTSVAMTETTIDAGTSGYGIIVWVESDVVINDSEISGYAALYMKDSSKHSKVNVNNSELKSAAVDSIYSFGTIVTEANDVTIKVDADSKVIAEAEDGQTQAALLLHEKKNLTIDIAEGATVTTDTLVLGYVEESNTIKLPSSLAELAISEGIGYVNETDGQIKLGGQVEENETVVAIDSEGKAYASLEDAVAKAADGSTITLMTDVVTNEVIKIEKNLTIDGQSKYTVTGNARKTFEVYEDTAFQNITITNTYSAGRCVDTRKAVDLTLTNVELTAINGNTQPLTIGGYEDGTTVTMSATNIEAGESGYGIISFVKTEMTISDGSSVNGYGALYMKEGSEGSVATVAGSVLSSKNVHSGESNAFGTIVTEADQITITVDKDSTVKAEATGDQKQAIFVLNEKQNLKMNIAEGAAVETATLAIGFVKETNTITVPSSLATLAVSEGIGYVTESNGQIKLGAQAADNNNQSGSSSSSKDTADDNEEKETTFVEVSPAPTTAIPTATGDSANILGYIVLIAAAGAALGLLFLKKRKTN